MGDRGHNRHGPKRLGAAVPVSRRATYNANRATKIVGCYRKLVERQETEGVYNGQVLSQFGVECLRVQY